MERNPTRHARLRLAATLLLSLTMAVPFLFAKIPPLVDAPGHLSQFAIQAAPVGSPLRHYFDFHWAFILNLGTELLVEALRHAFGLIPAFRLVVAAIPVVVALGILALARVANPRGRAGIGWAMLFVYSYPFLYGFLNYTLALGLSLCSYALWIALDRRRALRELLFWLIVPIVLVAHALGGALLLMMIGSREAARQLAPSAWRDPRALRGLLPTLRPLLVALPVLVLWKLSSSGDGPSTGTYIRLVDKINALVMVLRDQDRAFDIGSILLALAVLGLGWRRGARLSADGWAPVLALLLLFLLIPGGVSGTSFIDMRLVPVILILALALQDWSRVERRTGRAVLLAGFALLGARLAVTAASFADYDRSYRDELAALDHVTTGSRVLVLNTHYCSSTPWPSNRLAHLAGMATVLTQSWTNSHWDLGEIHLLHVRYKPSTDFYDDPSHYVWSERCVAANVSGHRRTVAQVLPRLPLDAVDYLWLIDVQLSQADVAGKGLVSLWSSGGSTLYATPGGSPPTLPGDVTPAPAAAGAARPPSRP